VIRRNLVIAVCVVLTACGGDETADPVTSASISTVSPPTTRSVFSDASTGSDDISSEPVESTESADQPSATNQPDVTIRPDDDSGDPGITDGQGGADTIPIDPTSDPAPGDAVETVPACEAFETFFDHFTQVVLVATLASETDDAGQDTEEFEVVRYLDLGDDIALLRAQLPGAVVQSFETIFKRIEAVPRLMTAAGFNQSEFDALIAAADANPPPDTALPDDQRLEAAAQSLVAQFGPFIDVLELVETIGDDDETNGTAWVTTNCPELSELVDA
jgi:hypothetical protein